MRYWKIFSVALLAALALCACSPGEARTSPPPKEPSREEGLSSPESWNAVEWTEHMEPEYAQAFSVDYAEGGFKRITIDAETYLVVSVGVSGLPFSDIPEDVTILPQPLKTSTYKATAAMDCFRKLDAMDAITLSGTQASGWAFPCWRNAPAMKATGPDGMGEAVWRAFEQRKRGRFLFRHAAGKAGTCAGAREHRQDPGLFRPPIAGPFVLGISSGAKLTVALVMVFFLSRGIAIHSMSLIAGAFSGSMLSMALCSCCPVECGR